MIRPASYEIEQRLLRPLYSYAEADRIAGVTRGTSSRWLKGYKYWYSSKERRKLPPITPESGHEGGVSFIDLVEVIDAGRLRAKGFSIKKIRQINELCQAALHTDRPLVTETFKVTGRDVFVMVSEGYLLNVGRRRGMQAWDEILDPFLHTLEYEDQIARRWWPRGKAEPVVVDPDYGFGLPVITGSGVRTEIIAERHRAGETNEEIAYDFGIGVTKVEAALRYELPQAA